MALGTATFFSVGFLLLLTQGGVSQTRGSLLENMPNINDKGPANFSIRLSVENDLSNITPESYTSSVVRGGVLLGALRRLQETQQGFKFTVKVDPDFGLLLESVNGVAGSDPEQTYWEILSETSGEYSRLDVGIGCYTPIADEHIILRFKAWPQQ